MSDEREQLRNELAWMLARVISKSTDVDGKPACECDGMITCHFCIASFIVDGRYGDAADQLAKWESLIDDPEAAVPEEQQEKPLPSKRRAQCNACRLFYYGDECPTCGQKSPAMA